jgi:hypothetical protein
MRLPRFVHRKTYASGKLRNGIGRYEAESMNFICSIFIQTIFKPFRINSGFHFNKRALFSTNCVSNTSALCAVAMTLLHPCRCSQRYVNRSPTGSSKNDWRFFPQRKQSTFQSGCFLLCVQNCWGHAKLGMCSVAISANFVSCVVSKP